jgi:signal transduction histidine kinase
VILPEIDRINELLKQFLTLSETKPAQFAKFNLNQLMKDVLRLLQPKAFLMGHEIKGDIPSEPIEVEADPEQIKQVLINLIQNGLESLSENGLVEVTWNALSEKIHIQVRDNGAGIKPGNVPRIFDPFFTTKGEGTGMGLSICHRIIAEHGGEIYVTTQPGRGTVFHILFPTCQAVYGKKEKLEKRELQFQN